MVIKDIYRLIEITKGLDIINIQAFCSGALRGIRTPNNGSEDRCDIHFTMSAYHRTNSIHYT